LFFWKGKGQIPFFKAHHPSTEKPKALVGFKSRTEPELDTGDSHSISTPPPPCIPMYFYPAGHITSYGYNNVYFFVSFRVTDFNHFCTRL